MVWYDPPKRIARLAKGKTVVVRGAIVRRFFRGGGGLGSSTELVIADAAPADSAWVKRIVAAVGEEISAVSA